jgi:hypothetical protein
VFNSQKGTEFHLTRVGNDPSEAIAFFNMSKQFRAGVDGLPHDGSPLRVSFDVPPNIKKKMLLVEYGKQRTAVVANASAPSVAEGPAPSRTVSSGGGSSPRRSDGVIEPHKVLPAGTLLQLQFANSITVDQVTPGKLFPATVVTARTAPLIAARGETLPDGTTVFVKITQGNGSQHLIQADHAVVRGADVPLDTNV